MRTPFRLFVFNAFLLLACYLSYGRELSGNDTLPEFTGKFIDDYGIRYVITDSVWTQLPRTRFHVLEWNKEKQYILTRNDDSNPTEKGLYTRIDYLLLPGMAPWTWAFCLTTYNAISAEVALKAASADREHPRKGCNGFPFSRLKKDSDE